MTEYGRNFLLLIAVSIISSIAQVLMRWGGKLSADNPGGSRSAWMWQSRWWLAGLGLGWCCGLVYAWLLRKIPLSLAWPITVGIIYALVIIMSRLFLHEKLGHIQAWGVFLIFAGIIMVCAQTQP